MVASLSALLGIDPNAGFRLARWLFLRALGLVYVTAFASLLVQVRGLVGARGILPAGEYLESVRTSRGGADPLRVPTVFWLRSDDRALCLGCGAGIALGVLLTTGVAPAACLLLLWALYLSFAAVGRVFLSYQWDVLLLEAGFAGVLLAPWQLLPGEGVASVPAAALVLMWWLLFRLHFQSGLGKLQSGDRTWRDLTALDHHFCTQPLPNAVSWFAHRLPTPIRRAGTALVHLLELVWPALIFAGAGGRVAAFAGLVLLQVLIFVTGNYTFFNLLALALCLLLLPDAAWTAVLPESVLDGLAALGAPVISAAGPAAAAPAPPPSLLHEAAAWLVGGAIAAVSLLVLWRQHAPAGRLPAAASRLLRLLRPFRTVNSYGLFRVMTTERPEIVVEGSRDGERWEPYEFRYKPGDPSRPPPWVAPHQPRLDWQMWFAALGSWQGSRWIHSFMARLLEGSEPVTGLLESVPFDDPPRYLRAVLYDYRFTTRRERRETGRWWRRERLGPYGPVLERSRVASGA